MDAFCGIGLDLCRIRLLLDFPALHCPLIPAEMGVRDLRMRLAATFFCGACHALILFDITGGRNLRPG